MRTLNLFLIGIVIGFMFVAWFNTTVTNSVDNLQQYEQNK